MPTAAPGTGKPGNSYGQILRSSALIGSSSAMTIVISIVRTKLMAMMLGPAGFGLMGALSTVADLARGLAQIGINSSGVRQIALASSSGNPQQLARTVTVLRFASVLLGALGAIALAVFSNEVATLTFGDTEHANAVALLSAAVFLRLISDGEGALLQGTRHIGDIAKLGVIGGLIGSVLSLALVYQWREEGLAMSLVAIAGASLLVSWWYSRKLSIPVVSMPTGHALTEAKQLLRLGVVFMLSALLMLGATYVVRLILIRFEGLAAAGLYQAAWAVGGLYVGFILQSMSADFYPRLVEAAGNNIECNRLVNEQTHISLLLAGPGVLATLVLAPMVIELFYSREFTAAAETLRWVCLGFALRVIAWPMGFIILAKESRLAFFLTDLLWAVVHVGAAWLAVETFGLKGAGIAFFASYVLHTLLVFPVVRRLSGFGYSPSNLKTAAAFIGLTAAVWAALMWLPSGVSAALGVAAIVFSGAYSVHVLMALFPQQQQLRGIQRWLGLWRALRAAQR